MSDDHQLGDQPIEERYRENMNALAKGLDDILNGEDNPDPHVGFILMVFPLNGHEGRCNYIAKARREDVIVLLKEQLARFEGMAAQEGSA